MSSIKDNLDAVELQIYNACLQANRERSSVELLAVSKTKPIELIEQAYHYGQRAFGENYVQEVSDKAQQLAHLQDIVWHFIGPIQSNKTRQIAQHCHWVHSVDRAKIITRLNDHRYSHDTPLNVCLQVNISEEASKSGATVEEVYELAELVAQSNYLVLRGLMAIPEKDNADESFAKMNALYNSLKDQYNSVDTLSMGMSGDLTSAIRHGSTMVRIGTAIFGRRD
ncbi:YggS family pyridoxal phosphate-dependent enzyme [Thalassotalea fusca]